MKVMPEGYIFVFGSNLKGIHGAGSAKSARLQYGAELGVGIGPTGQCYAIPTCSEPGRPLNIGHIGHHINNFRDYAAEHPELTFWVTRVGCGYAGFADSDISPLFDGCGDNVMLPEAWGGEGIDF